MEAIQINDFHQECSKKLIVWEIFFKFSMISSDGVWRSWGFNLSMLYGNPLKIDRVGKTKSYFNLGFGYNFDELRD